jgi:hypothetical protein
VVNDEDHPAEVSVKLSPTEVYQRTFPNGHSLLRVDSEGLLCGYRAVIASMEAQHPWIQAPTIDELQQIRVRPDVVIETTKCDLETEESNFHVELLAYLLEEWGRTDNRDLDLHLAFYVEPDGPYLIYPNDDAPDEMVWNHSDGASWVNPENPSHYSGMKTVETTDSDADKKSTMENWQGNWQGKAAGTFDRPVAEIINKPAEDWGSNTADTWNEPAAEKAKGAALTQNSLTQVSSAVVFENNDTNQMLFEQDDSNPDFGVSNAAANDPFTDFYANEFIRSTHLVINNADGEPLEVVCGSRPKFGKYRSANTTL